MCNTIKRNTIFIEAITLTNSSAFNQGQYAGYYKNENCWLTKDAVGKKWQALISNLRNENFHQFINQYSMAEIVQYLRDKNENYYTVVYEMLVDAIKTTFEETRICCINDIYEYISKNLI